MKWSRQTLFGLAFFAGGSVMLFALIKQINPSDTVQPQPIEQVSTLSDSRDSYEVDAASQNTLTADVETEQRILAQKQKERLARVAEQERRTKAFLAEQERAEALALRKAKAENERYRQNSAAEPIPDTESLERLSAQSGNTDNSSRQSSESSANSVVTRPTISKRPTAESSTTVAPSIPVPTLTAIPASRQLQSTSTPAPSNTANDEAPRQAFDYTVKRGDGLIKLARRYHMPVEALKLANDIQDDTTLRVGQTLEIPSRKQVARLLREQALDNNAQDDSPNTPATGAPPASPMSYTVARGDRLIKLSHKYDMPVEVLAQANNISPNATLRVGQRITIPSRAQISRLKREAEEEKRRKQALQAADERLRQARREARSEDNKRYGVQVALADDQERANEVASKLRAAGYRVSTSPTNRGVRVIVGPETGKEAALALKDKINADSRTDVNGAWVLSWR